MRKGKEKFLLVLVTVCLVAAPLRGVLALPAPDAVDDGTAHCAHMQDGMQGMGHGSGRQDTGGRQSDHGCGHGCGGDCCNGKCGGCVHATLALCGAMPAVAGRLSHTHAPPVSSEFDGCTTHPPFRPPISRS